MLHDFSKQFEKIDNFETDYLKILYYDLSKDYIGDYKSYQYTRVCTIAEGTKHVRINDGSEFTYKKNEFIILPPNSTVHMDIKEQTTAIVYEISDRLIEDTITKLQNHFNTPVPMDSLNIDKLRYNPELQTQLNKINTIFTGKDPNKGFLIDLYSQALIYTLLKDYKFPVESKKNREPVAYTIQYFKEHIYSQTTTIKEIAYSLNLSPSNLIQLFKNATGMTPKEYQNHLKLNQSKEDLLVKNVSEVAYDLGFESISYFIKLFKAHNGVTPKQYTLLHRKRADEQSSKIHQALILSHLD